MTVFITTYAMILPAITMEPSPGVKLQRTFRYENQQVYMLLEVEGRAALEEDPGYEVDLTQEQVELTVTPLEDNSSVRAAYEAYAQDNILQEDLYQLLTMRLIFTHEGRKLDMSKCRIHVQIAAKEEMLQQIQKQPASGIGTMSTQGVAAAQDQVLAITAFQGVGASLDQQDTAYLAQDNRTLSVSTSLVGDTMAVVMYSTVNPIFTVQYYTYFEKLATSGDKALDELDTSGGKLPVNGGPNNMTNIYLNSVGSGKYMLAVRRELGVLERQVDDYAYVSAPGVAYVDRMRQNGNYVLQEVWVLKEGKSQTSTNRNDWDIYPATVGFTNREASAGPNRIHITDGTVLRLVYEGTEGSYTNAADFYDYDISDGYTTKNGVSTAVTANNGINSFTAKAGTVKYAFGNSNSLTNFGDLTWRNNGKDNALNEYNYVNSAYDGCTFGLVTGIQSDGTLIFANGISAPVLYGQVDGKGKTYYDDYSLRFNRSGDTYTLVAVTGTSANNLDQFNNPSYTYNGTTTTYSNIFTNNFWPMDSVWSWGASGHDPKFGSISKNKTGKVMAKNGSSTKALPPADDGLDHNSFFGMQYKLTFTLTEDYMGPLDYVFYGDDDMWVFLDGQLVCDIGGVHSSVGQYVNLWDYINQMPDILKYGEHTLYFCYTERGASGSSCYMRFTLPSVDIETPQVESATLELSKEVLNVQTDEEFAFRIDLTDANGDPLVDDYSYTRYDADGNELEVGILSQLEQTVYLRDGERIVIHYLPKGTKFTITEAESPGFHQSSSINGGATTDGSSSSGSVTEDIDIVFYNASSVILPETGGQGWLIYTLPMGIAIAFALSLPLLEKAWNKFKH